MTVSDADGNQRSVTMLEYYFTDISDLNTVLIQAGVSGNWMSVLLPVLVSIPALFSFADAEQSGYWRFLSCRQSRRQYARRSCLTVCISGIAAIVLGYLLFSACILWKYPSPETYYIDGEPMPTQLSVNPLCKLLGKESVWLWLLLRFALTALVSWLCILVCLVVYSLTQNRYQAIGVPLIGTYLLNNIASSLFVNHNWDERFYLLSPKELLSSSEFWFEDAFGISFWLLPMGLLLFCIILFSLCTKLINWRHQI